MDDLSINQLCALLTKADITCGYIRNDSIVTPRDELIKERLLAYRPIVDEVYQQAFANKSDLTSEHVNSYLFAAVNLVKGDIESLFISLDPVLYDRDSMIKERILSYYNMLINMI